MDYRYWDAVTFVGWLAAEPDKVEECRPVIEAAEGRSVVLVTSALTLTEVLWFKGDGQQKLSAHHAKKIEDFFRHQWIVVREVDRFIAEAARDVVWSKNVKPKDAIHIATALQQDVQFDQFDTFDSGLIKLSGMLGSPPLTIGRPNLQPNLPLFEKEDEEP